MTRTALVVENGPNVLVKNDDVPSAKASTSRRFWGVKERSYSVVNPQAIELAAGDTVEIFLPPGRTVLAAAITFLLPLVMFPVGYSLAGVLSGAAVNEGVAFLSGFAALLLGLPLGALLRRIAGGLSGVPEITRVLSPAEVLSCKISAGCGGDCGACG